MRCAGGEEGEGEVGGEGGRRSVIHGYDAIFFLIH